mgnify:FL=1
MRPPVKHPDRLSAPARAAFQASQQQRRPLVDQSGVALTADVAPPPVSDRWQSEAYLFTYAVPEVRYVVATKAQLLSQCHVRVEQRVPGTDRWERTDDRRATAVLRALQPEIGEQSQIVAQASVHGEVAGSAWFYGDPVRNDLGRVCGFNWSFLSTSALKVERRGDVVTKTWGKGAFEHKAPPDGHIEYALLSPDWEYPDRPKSSVFSVLPSMKTLVLCRQLLDAMARRQTNADVFFAPSELDDGPVDEWDNPADPGTGRSDFESDLHEYTGDAVADQTSPNRLNPLLVTGPGLLKHGDKAWPMKELLGLIPLAKDFEGYLAAERAELLESIARGLDIEPEIMTGTARVNQWGSYMVSEAFVMRHVVPQGRLIVAWLTSKYLRPMMRAAYRMARGEVEQYRLALDPSPIFGDPDLSKLASEGHELGVVSDEAWIKHAGLDESDVPSDDEAVRRFFRRLVAKYPDLGPAVLPLVFPDRDLSEVLAAWPVNVRGGGGVPGAGEGGGGAPAPVKRPGSRPEPNVPHGRPTSVDQAVRVAVTVAAEPVDRGCRTAGARLVGNLASRDPDEASRLRGVDPARVLTAAGAGLVRRSGLTGDMLIGSAFDEFEAQMVEWLAHEVIGDSDPNERRRLAAVAAGELVAQLRLVVLDALERPLRPGPNGTVVPDELVRSALAAAKLADPDLDQRLRFRHMAKP